MGKLYNKGKEAGCGRKFFVAAERSGQVAVVAIALYKLDYILKILNF